MNASEAVNPFSVVSNVTSFPVSRYQCLFFSRPNFKIPNFDLENLHDDKIFEKQDILQF